MKKSRFVEVLFTRISGKKAYRIPLFFFLLPPAPPMSRKFSFLLLGLVLVDFTHAAPGRVEQNFTSEEIVQGFSDTTVLAKPRSDRLATIDQEEAEENLITREKFSRFGGLRVIGVPPGENVESVLHRLRATGRYEVVEPDYINTTDAIPSDPSFASQWSLSNSGQITNGVIGADIKALTAWDIIHDAPNVVVAVIDSGVNLRHQDIAANLWVNPAPTINDVNGIRIINGVRNGDPTDDVGHGTHVAGIIGAVGNNGIGMSGVAWRVQLMICKNGTNVSLTSDTIACLEYAVAHGAKIVNCSFGNTTFSQTFFNALRAARDSGVIIVAAAGNSGLNNDVSPHYPANYLLDNMVSVGNSTAADAVAVSSDYGSLVELFAPGSSIVSLNYANNTGTLPLTGTSMSAPHVVGALALLKARFPSDTPRQLINRLLAGVDRVDAFKSKAQTGGRLNLFKALSTTSNRPFNDDFASRGTVATTGGAMRSNNVGATKETGEPSPAGLGTTGSLWWEWTAPVSAGVSINTAGSDFDTVLAVYSGTSLSSLTEVATNDNDGTRTSSRLSFSAVKGTTYYIAVSGKNGGAGFVAVNLNNGPANDSFATATNLTSTSSLQAAGTTVRASYETGEPIVTGTQAGQGGASVWFRWTAPRAGRFQISSFSLIFDTLLGIYTGTDVDELTVVAENDNTGLNGSNLNSLCTINAVAGAVYFIKVDTKDPTKTGDFTLTITDSLWQASTLGINGNSAAVANDGTLYIGGGTPDFGLYAIAPDGSIKWVHQNGGTLDNCSPAIGPDGTLYFGTSDGKVTALFPGASSGVVRWQRTVGTGSISNSPALGSDGTIYLHSNDGYLYALDPSDGSTKWRFNVNARSTFASASVGADGTIYQASSDQNIYAIKPDGTLRWQFAMGSDSFSIPALDAAGNLYVTTYTSARLLSLTKDGVLRWSFPTGSGTLISGSPTLSAEGTTVYFGATNRIFYAVNAATGIQQWSLTLGGPMLSSTPAIDTNGVIYVGTYDNKLYAISSNGAQQRTWDMADIVRSSPVIFGTTLYVASYDSKLYALDIGAFAAGGPWPQYRHNTRHLGRAVIDPLGVTVSPRSTTGTNGQTVVFDVTAIGQGPFSYQWQRNGSPISGATSSTYSLVNSTSASGIYTVSITGPQGSTTSAGAALGLTISSKTAGSGREVGSDIVHANGNIFDQVLLEGAAATFTADPTQITRMSFLDLNDDIVQIEYFGVGTVSVVLDAVSGPAGPVKYNQSGVTYMKGHAGIVISGANENSNLSVFSVGRGNAVNQALFRDDVTYDGFADIAFIAISSSNGKFGGVRTANTSYFATKGLTGIYAPGVQFTGPVFIGDINASDNATPVITLGAGSDVRITGGDLLQTNNRAVQISGVNRLVFAPGSTSHDRQLPAQNNRARLEQNGTDVTAQVVVNPTP